jgi:hypothetical protein
MADQIKGHVTTEKHRKSLKFQQLLATLTLAFGVALIVFGFQGSQPGKTSEAAVNGGITCFGGAVWLFITKALMWWHHG